MPSHIFTKEEAARGGRGKGNTYKQLIKLERLRLKEISKAEWMDFAKQAIANPAVIGTLVYLAVRGMNSASQQSQPNPTNASTIFNTLFGGFLHPILNLGGQVGTDGLELALLIYIASGGNLAGTLQSSGNIISGLIKSVPAP